MKFTEEQINEIKKCKPNCCYDDYGRKGDLVWGIDGNSIYIDIEYEARDVDGDWGYAIKRHNDVTFDELIKTIREPYRYFDTRSWN